MFTIKSAAKIRSRFFLEKHENKDKKYCQSSSDENVSVVQKVCQGKKFSADNLSICL